MPPSCGKVRCSWIETSARRLPQSPLAGCRNNRAVGYQGESLRSSSHRQSLTHGSRSQTGLAMAPAIWATTVSTVMDQIHGGDQCGGVREVVLVSPVQVKLRCRRQIRGVFGTNVDLEGVKDERQTQKRLQLAQRDTAAAVVHVVGIAGPGQTDVWPVVIAEPLPDRLAFGRVGEEIRARPPGSSLARCGRPAAGS